MANRTASSSAGERLRSTGSGSGESLRSGPTRAPIDERLNDVWIRDHPLTPGCTIYSIQGVAGVGKAGCAVAGFDRGWRE